MTKADIVNEVANKMGIDKKAAATTVEHVIRAIRNQMVAGNNVCIHGFGTFSVVKRKDKPARNIGRNETIIIPAHKVPVFKASKQFKEAVKRNG